MDLEERKRERAARLAAANKVGQTPLPPARVPPVATAERPRPMVVETRPTQEIEPAPSKQSDQVGKIETDGDTQTVAPNAQEQKPKASMPDKREAAKTAPKDVQSPLRVRISVMLSADDLMKRAVAVAAKNGSTLDDVYRAIATDTKVLAQDYTDAGTPSPVKKGDRRYRFRLSLDRALAESWIKKHDPLGVRSPDEVLRAVGEAAFERTARVTLARLENSK